MSKPIRLVPKSQSGCLVLVAVVSPKAALWALNIHTAVTLGLLGR